MTLGTPITIQSKTPWLLYSLICIAIIGISLGAYTALKSAQTGPKNIKPYTTPPSSTFNASVAGLGIVEANTENINLGTQLSGIVQSIFVVPGQNVKEGDPLFALDQRAYKAAVDYQKANLDLARSQLATLKAMPRKETVPPYEATMNKLKYTLDEAKVLWNNVQGLTGTGAINEETYVLRKLGVEAARYSFDHAKYNLDLIKAGAWSYDIATAEAQVEVAAASLEIAQVNLALSLVQAPVDCTILRINIHLGEFALSGELATPLMVIGGTQPLNVRVNIDEKDIPRFLSSTPAYATSRGDSQKHYPLTYVRTEPLVVPKLNLNGSSTEQVDTRVLQVIYALPKDATMIYVGQQMDVFIEENKEKEES